jgi:RpiR family transcriptional regulator, carbohydrate utilization regulator
MLNRLPLALDTLRPAERKVAEVVLRQPERVMRGTLLSVAREAEVSEPTVLRFCRSFGFNSFNDLKLDLAHQLARRDPGPAPPMLPARVYAQDSVAAATDKVFQTAIEALTRTAQVLPRAAIERAAFAVVKARRVVIFGFGASAIVAADAQHKLFLLAVAAAAYSDAHLQAMAAATLGPEDVVIAVSQTGQPRDLIETASVALQGGATLIAISRTGSPLAGIATILIPVDIEEALEIWTPMVSRLAHLTVIDALVVGVALLAPPSSAECLKRMRAAVGARRLNNTPDSDSAPRRARKRRAE